MTDQRRKITPALSKMLKNFLNAGSAQVKFFPTGFLIAQSKMQAGYQANPSELYPKSAGNVCFLIDFLHWIVNNRSFSHFIRNYLVSWHSCNDFGGFYCRHPAIEIMVIPSMVIGFNPYHNYEIAMSKSWWLLIQNFTPPSVWFAEKSPKLQA